MADLLARQLVVLDSVASVSFTSLTVDLDPQTQWIEIEIERETSATVGVVWPDNATLGVRLQVLLDGQLYEATGRSTGGIRQRDGVEAAYYRMRWNLPSGYFDGHTGKRLGERAISTFRMRVGIRLLAGAAVTTRFRVIGAATPLLLPTRTNSVGFDNSESAVESFGDGVISFSVLAGSADDRGALVAIGARGDSLDGTLTIDGGGETISSALWDVVDAGLAINSRGFSIVGYAAGTRTLTNDLTDSATNDHFLGIVLMTDVKQSAPTGNVAAVAPAFDTQPSCTVTGVDANDMVVDFLMVQTSTPVAGADQTEREAAAGAFPTAFRMSTQPGSAGGEMSWTYAGSAHRALNAVVFKEAVDEDDGLGPGGINSGTINDTDYTIDGPEPAAVGGDSITGGTIASGSTLNAPSVRPRIVGGTRASAAVLSAPTVKPRITTGTKATASTLAAPSVKPRLVTGTKASGSQLFAPTVKPRVTTSTIAAGSVLTAPTVAQGGTTVVSGTITSASTRHAPSVRPVIVSGTRTSTATLSAPTVRPRVTAATITPGATLTAPRLAPRITTGTRPSTATLTAPRLTVVVTSASIASAAQLRAPTVRPRVVTGTIASSSVLRAPSVSTSGSILGPTIPSASQLFAPSARVGVLAATIPSGATVTGPRLALRVGVGTIASTATVSAPRLTAVVLGPAITATPTFGAPSVGVAVRAASLGSGSILFAPRVASSAPITSIVRLDGSYSPTTALRGSTAPTRSLSITLPTTTAARGGYAPTLSPVGSYRPTIDITVVLE